MRARLDQASIETSPGATHLATFFNVGAEFAGGEGWVDLNVSALVGALSLSDVTLGSGAPLEIALALESSDVSGDYAFSSLEEVAPMLVLSVVAAPPPTPVPSPAPSTGAAPPPSSPPSALPNPAPTTPHPTSSCTDQWATLVGIKNRTMSFPTAMYTNLFEATTDLEALQEWWSYTEDPPHVEYTMTMRVTSTCDETMRFGFQGLGGAGAFLVAEVPANADARYIEVTGVIGRSTSDYHVRNSYAATIDTCEVTFSDIKFSLSECVETAVPTQSPVAATEPPSPAPTSMPIPAPTAAPGEPTALPLPSPTALPSASPHPHRHRF